MRFIKKKNNLSHSAKRKQLSQKDIPLSKWYQSIYELPLRQFEDCLINNNLSALVISGFPLPDVLQAAWVNILQEYADAIGNSEHRMYMNLMKELEMLRIDVECLKILTTTLRSMYSKYFCQQLNEMTGASCQFNWDDQKSYQRDIDRCERRGKSYKIRYDEENGSG